MATIEIPVSNELEFVLSGIIEKLFDERFEEKFSELIAENEKLKKRGWWDDQHISDYFGKSYSETQRLLRLMEKDVVANRYISKDGGRSTRADIFEKWLMHYEANKYTRNKKPFIV